MKNLLLFFTFCLFFLSLQAQVNEPQIVANKLVKKQVNAQVNLHLLGRSRIPLNTSFYSKNMWDYDGFREGLNIKYTKKDISLFGLEKKIKTSGKVIVYDASVTSITDNAFLGKDGIIVNPNNVFVNTTDKTLLIPIIYSGGVVNFTKAEKNLISEYVNKSLSHSGATPSKIKISLENGDFNIEIFKSQFTNEDAIIKGHNLRSRTEKETESKEIKQLIDGGKLEGLDSRLNAVIDKYPEVDEFYSLREKLQAINFVSQINQRSGGVVLRYVEENPIRFSVFDGLTPKNDYKVMEKQNFVDQLINSTGPNTRTIYLDVKGLTDNKAEALVTSTNIQMAKTRSDLRVKRAPKTQRGKEEFFNGKVISEAKNIKPQVGVNGRLSELRAYNILVKGKKRIVGLGLKVNKKINDSKFSKIANSFFKLFNKTTKKQSWNISDAVDITRVKLEKKYKDLKPQDYDGLFRDEIGTMNIVIIEDFESEFLLANGKK